MQKRSFDLLAALFGLLLLLPLLLPLALLIRLDSSGPIFFRQQRLGRDGVPFNILKFRSMTVAGSDGAQVTAGSNARITRVGRLLRRSRIDELPQLWNVLKGEMSLVGPRPEVARFADPNEPVRREILSVRPGITGLTQLLYRDEESMFPPDCDVERFYREELLPRKNRCDLYYVRHQNLPLDLRLILYTLIGGAPSLPHDCGL